MFYDETKAIIACDEDPSLIFELLKEEHIYLIDKIKTGRNRGIVLGGLKLN